ncbi:MAG TPA: hypothetical protein VFE17_04055 [Candidatus Baltobacteraceae bacterium]|nr:hypothetical protein [Candidatus Baltobacteraceae bacterium]
MAERDIETEAPYDDIRPEDAWRELADLAQPDLADRFHEMDSDEARLTVWRHGCDPASRQLARAVSNLPANAHIRGLQRAAGLARFASIGILRRSGLSGVNGCKELRAAIDAISQADARTLLHDLAAGAALPAWKTIWREAFLAGVNLGEDEISDREIHLGLARRAGIPESNVGEPAYYQALRELPVQVAQDLLQLTDMGIFEAPDAETIQALHDAAQSVPKLETLALNTLRGRAAWEALARDVGCAELTGRDDRAAHEEVLLQVMLASTPLREALARAAGLDHLLYSHRLRERAQRDVPPEVAAWRELTARLGLPEYRLSHADPNARRTVAAASLRLGTHTLSDLLQTAGLSGMRDQIVKEQRAAFFERKQPADAQRARDGRSL